MDFSFYVYLYFVVFFYISLFPMLHLINYFNSNSIYKLKIVKAKAYIFSCEAKKISPYFYKIINTWIKNKETCFIRSHFRFSFLLMMVSTFVGTLYVSLGAALWFSFPELSPRQQMKHIPANWELLNPFWKCYWHILFTFTFPPCNINPNYS